MARSPCPLDFDFRSPQTGGYALGGGWGGSPPRPEKIEQKRARELTKVIQLSPNTAAGGFRAQTRRASFAGRPPTPRRRFWRAIAPRLNLRGGMVVRTRARQTRRRTLRLGVNPMQPAQKSETAKRTSRTARPTRTRSHRRPERRSWHRSHDRQPLKSSETAKRRRG